MKKVRPFLDKGIQLRASVKCTVHVFPNIWLWTDGLYFTIIPPPTGKSPESFAYHNSYLTVTMARIIMQPHSPLKSLPPPHLSILFSLSLTSLSFSLSLTSSFPPSLSTTQRLVLCMLAAPGSHSPVLIWSSWWALPLLVHIFILWPAYTALGAGGQIQCPLVWIMALEMGRGERSELNLLP